MKPRIAILFGTGAALLAAACRPPSPEKAGVPDDIEAIENALQRNAAELEAEGLAVQAREAPSGAPAPAVAPEPAPAPTEPSAAEEAPPSPAPESADVEATVQSRSSREDGSSGAERRRAARSRSERICELASVTCELAERVCGLAARHGDDPRYTDACARAEHQCDVASDACHAG